MTQPTDYSEMFIGSAEAAKLLRVGPTNFSHLRKKMQDAGDENFPKPAIQFRMGPAWLKTDMLKFKKYYDARGDGRRRHARPENAPKTTKADIIWHLVGLQDEVNAKISQAIEVVEGWEPGHPLS